jgi:hypothetical protein
MGRSSRCLPAGGVLSLVVWSLVVNELLVELNGFGCNAMGYADDIASLGDTKADSNGVIAEVCPSTQAKR